MKKQVILAISLLLGGFTQLEAANFIGYVNKEGVLDTIKVNKDAFYKAGDVKATYFEAFVDSAKYIGFVDFYTNNIPDTIVEIRAKAFENCSTVSAICIPASVTSLDCSAFDGCALDSLFSMNATPPTLTNGSLPSGLQKIKVPGDYVNAYKAAAGWSAYEDKIVAIPKVNTNDDYVLLSYSKVTVEEVKHQLGFSIQTKTTETAHFFCKLTLKDLFLWDDKLEVKDTLASELQLFKDYNTLTKNIHLVRTFNENGTRHTLCLPFGVTKAQFNESALGKDKTVTIQTFTGANVTNPGESNEALEITVADVNVSGLGDNDTLLYAGKPYILTWANTGKTILWPVFKDVRLNLSELPTPEEKDDVKMQGVFWRTGLEKENYSTLFISPDGSFSWPSKTNDMRGFRAYFLVNTSSSSPIRKGMPVRLNEVSGKSMPTAIDANQFTDSSFKIQNSKFIRNGQLIIRRDNVEYTIMGGQIR